MRTAALPHLLLLALALILPGSGALAEPTSEAAVAKAEPASEAELARLEAMARELDEKLGNVDVAGTARMASDALTASARKLAASQDRALTRRTNLSDVLDRQLAHLTSLPDQSSGRIARRFAVHPSPSVVEVGMPAAMPGAPAP